MTQVFPFIQAVQSRAAPQSRVTSCRPVQSDSTSTSFASIATAASLPASSIRALAPPSSTAAACSTVAGGDDQQSERRMTDKANKGNSRVKPCVSGNVK